MAFVNKVHTVSSDPEIRLRWDWNSLLNDAPDLLFPEFSSDYFPQADDLVHYLAEFQRRHAVASRAERFRSTERPLSVTRSVPASTSAAVRDVL
jgi:hypothetical protein